MYMCVCVCVFVCLYLSTPHRVGGVGLYGGASLLAVVREAGEAAPLARLDGYLQVRVRVKEHALLQTHCTKVCRGASH